jgi:hypothetical protein
MPVRTRSTKTASWYRGKNTWRRIRNIKKVAGRIAKNQAHVQRDAQTDLVKQQCAAGEINLTAAKEAALRA